MGVFDTYGNTQLKAGDPWQRQYAPNDTVKIPDGVYIDFEDKTSKAVVIKAGVFIGEFDIFDYWGEAWGETND